MFAACRWKKNDQGEWLSTFADKVWVLKQDSEGSIHYKVLESNGTAVSNSNASSSLAMRASRKRKANAGLSESQEEHRLGDHEHLLRDYFQMNVDLEKLYEQWSAADEVFRDTAVALPGIRILRQDPFEALVAFICSSNNNITRISSMVNKLCEMYGTQLLSSSAGSFYAFPTAEQLDKDSVEPELKAAGFGYRARYVRAAAKAVSQRDPHWLASLRKASYPEAHSQLLQLPGVGPKVADCVCLMALDKADVVPVDVHVWKLAVRHYLPQLSKHKNLTTGAYREIGDFFRDRFGPYAGWAHSVSSCPLFRG
ncbi:unnamed protein product [Ixodes hexagonus]